MKWMVLISLGASRVFVEQTTRLALLTLIGLSANTFLVNAAEAIISVPVKVLSPRKKNNDMESQMILRTPAPPMPTMPSGKLPQYQFGESQQDDMGDRAPSDPICRWILAIPHEPIIIEFSITIDGKPFRLARDERVKRLVKDAAQPVTNLTPDNKPDETSKVSASPNAADRIRHYFAATGSVANEREVRWFLDQWIDGPQTLLLNDNFQRFRGNHNPVFIILDRDRDGTVSADELADATKSFLECDMNRDGVVETTEIDQVARDPRNKPNTAEPGRMLFSIPHAEFAASTYETLAARYTNNYTSTKTALQRFDLDANGTFDATELASIEKMEADMTFAIAFDSEKPTSATMKLIEIHDRLKATIDESSAIHSSIQVQLGSSSVHFSAVQAGASDQISWGAVHDGYPLLPELDPNDDGRFTTRELRTLNERLAKFDSNRDGKLVKEETRSPIRVCVGLGALVHGELAAIRSVPVTPATIVQGPAWFGRMDRNKDNDLTRDEFPGTDDQFVVIDTDGDKLISAEEALNSEKQ